MYVKIQIIDLYIIIGDGMNGSGGERPEKRLVIVDIVKAVSCIMIFLYHCNTILPGEWKFLTLFGQDLGNNLFFMVSGFALAPSAVKTPLKEFPLWYKKRLIRILPITAIAYFLTWLRGYFSFRDPVQLFAVFIYPTLYWFITAILIFYIILFLLAKLERKQIMLMIMAALAVIFILLNERQERLYVIGLYSMLAGYLLRLMMLEGHPLTEDKPVRRRFSAAGIIAGFILFMAGETTDIPCVSNALILAGVSGFGLCALLCGYFNNEKAAGGFASSYWIRYPGDMALPLYLVQCFCSGYPGFWIGLHISFPLSFLVNLIVVWTAGTILYIVEKYIFRCYTKKMLIKSAVPDFSEKNDRKRK